MFNVSVIATWGARLSTVCVSLLTIPVVIGQLDTEIYSFVILLQTIQIWAILFDFGLGKSVQNEIVVKDSFSLRYKYLKYFFIILFSLLVLCILIWNSKFALLSMGLLNKEFYVTQLIFLFVVIFSGFLEHIYNIFYGLGKSILVNSLMILASLITLAGIFLFKESSTLIILCLLFIPLLVVKLILFFIFLLLTINFIPAKELSGSEFSDKNLYKKSIGFFYFNIMACFTLYIDYIIVYYIAGLSSVDLVMYGIISKIYMTGYVFYSSLLLLTWSDFTQAYKINDLFQITKTLKSRMRAFLIIIPACSIILYLSSFELLNFFGYNQENLIGHSNFIGLIFGFSIYYMVRVWTDTHGMILQSSGFNCYLVKIVPYQAFLSIIFQLGGVLLFGVEGVLFGLILSFILTTSWYLPKKVKDEVKVSLYV